MREGAKFYVMRWRTAVVLILSQIVNSASPALSPGNSPEDEKGSRPTVPCFAIRAGEYGQARHRAHTLRARGQRG